LTKVVGKGKEVTFNETLKSPFELFTLQGGEV
jgi:hypothetical protein